MSKRLLSFFFISLLVLNGLAFFPSKPFVKAASGTWYVDSSYDDTYELNNVKYPTNTRIRVKAETDAASRYHGGVHFDSVTVPQGATITNATIQLNIYSASYDDFEFRIYCHDVDDSADFDVDPEVDGRTRTTDSHHYSAAGVGTGWYEFNVTDCVVEVLGREGWNSGNDLTFMFIGENNANNRRVDFYSFDEDSSYRAQLDILYTPPPPSPTYDSLDTEAHVFYDEYVFLNATVSVPGGHVSDLVNCTIGLNDGIVLKYDNATDTWSEYADPSSYVVLNSTACVRTSLNSTQVELSFNVKFVSPCPPERKDASASTTKVFQDDGEDGARSSVDWFYLWRTGNVLGVEDGEFAWGYTNASGTESILNQTSEADVNLLGTYDNATLTTRSLSDFGSAVTNYATLYVVDYEFVWGWSATIYDVYRNQSYECIGEPGYQDWLYTGLIAPPGLPTSFPSEIPWYVPVVGYLSALLLPFMIIAYYWNKARDFKSGLMVMLVCLLCFMLMLILWNLSDALTYWMYR